MLVNSWLQEHLQQTFLKQLRIYRGEEEACDTTVDGGQ